MKINTLQAVKTKKRHLTNIQHIILCFKSLQLVKVVFDTLTTLTNLNRKRNTQTTIPHTIIF